MNDDPKKQPDQLIEDHEYDGIKEYDNPMPRWWLYIFYATIAYSVLYWLNVPGIGIGRGRIAGYERDVAQARERYGEIGAAVARLGAAEVEAALADPQRLEAGKKTYMTNCMPCHKADGGGSIGPNLTDAYWIHGGTIADRLNVVSNGVLDKGMPAWSTVLGPDEVAAVVAYVTTLEGTSPPGARGPQGVNADSAAAIAPDAAGAAP